MNVLPDFLTLGVILGIGAFGALCFCFGYLTRQLREEPESYDSYGDWSFDPFGYEHTVGLNHPECVDALHRSGDRP